MFRKWIGILCAAVMLFSITGCGQQEEETAEQEEPAAQEEMQETEDPDEDTADEEEDEDEDAGSAAVSAGVSEAEAYQIYAGILEENREGIEGYTWQAEPGKKEDDFKEISKPVAFCDVNGDGVPELFFMTAVSDYEAYLHIYTIVNGEARDLIYPMDENETGKLVDYLAGGGVEYALFTGKDGNLYAFYAVLGESSQYTLYKDRMKNGQILREGKVQEVFGPDFDDDGNMKDELLELWFVDDQETDKATGEAAFNDAYKDGSALILYSARSASTLVGSVDPSKALAVSYKDALKLAKGKQ